jgi:hypothetical protein
MAAEEHARRAELPEIKEQMNRMLRAHYASWLTTEIPAPRQPPPSWMVPSARSRRCPDSEAKPRDREHLLMQ